MVNLLKAQLEKEVLAARQRLCRAKAPLAEDHGRERELVEHRGRREAERDRCGVLREVGAAVVELDGRDLAQRIGRGAGQDVHDARCAAHAEHREESRPTKLGVACELLPRGVEEPAQVEVVAAGPQGRVHDGQVEDVGPAVDDRGSALHPLGEGLGVARIGRIGLGRPGAVACGDAAPRGEVGVEEQDPEALTAEIEDRGAAHGAGATQHGHETALIP